MSVDCPSRVCAGNPSWQGSARNKPNKQTLFPWTAVPLLMHSLPLRKIKNLGGKLGKVGSQRPRLHVRAPLFAPLMSVGFGASVMRRASAWRRVVRFSSCPCQS